MESPSVVCVMLTRNRPEFAARAVKAFQSQTYPAKTLLIVNSGFGPIIPNGYAEGIMEPCFIGADALTIGELRNLGAKTAAQHNTEIIIHWDDDDYSHPNRIAEQVQLLQSSGADVVGYNSMLFWREPYSCTAFGVECLKTPGEAWLYQNPNPNYALGTSLAYWRHVWERKPFEATSIGEDERFLRGLKVLGVRSIGPYRMHMGNDQDGDARMICRIHAGNTSTAYSPRKMEAEARKKDGMWKRVPEWDAYCAETMK